MKRLAPLAFLGVAFSTYADRLPLPSDTPATYRAECGACHLAYPPALLSAEDWRRIVAGLGQHFGSDAMIAAPQRLEITAFLERYSGDPGKIGSASNQPRISQTARFIRKHHEVPAKFWRDPRVKSAANCEACHRGASDGRFGEHDISIPELRE